MSVWSAVALKLPHRP